MIPTLLVLLASLAVSVHGAASSPKWKDVDVSEPKDFRVSRFGLNCNTQIVFKRGGLLKNDQSYSYSVIGITDEGKDIDIIPEPIRPSRTPISAVNASAGHLRGAYRLSDANSDYSLLPIQFSGCEAGIMINNYQIKASKEGQPDWISSIFKIQIAPPPDQITNLKAWRNAKHPSKVHVSWDFSDDKYTDIAGAFVIAGKSNFNDRVFSKYIKSKFVDGGKSKTTITIGPVAVNITVVRYDSHGNGALSNVFQCPQVQV